jgi:histidine triad (HIT) family protein
VDDCLFCKIARKALPADVVFEDDAVLAFRDIHPKYVVHILIIPKKHLASAAAATSAEDALLGRLLRTGADIAQTQGIAESGFRLLTNTGSHSGQAVDHLHVHLLGGEPLRPL